MKNILKKLENFEDIFKFKDSHKNLLYLILFAKKQINQNIKNHYKLKKKESLKKKIQKKGFFETSKEEKISSSILIKFYFGLNKITKEIFEEIYNKLQKNLKEDLKKAYTEDLVYSPWGEKILKKIARNNEKDIEFFLEKNKIKYTPEKNLRNKNSKTPDILLNSSIIFRKSKIKWIEIKANYGDLKEYRKNQKQINKYNEFFGKGILIYCYDFDPKILEIEKKTIIITKKNFKLEFKT